MELRQEITATPFALPRTPVTRFVILPNRAHALHVRRSGLYTAAAEGHAGLPGNGNYQSQIRGAAADTGMNSFVFQR